MDNESIYFQELLMGKEDLIGKIEIENIVQNINYKAPRLFVKIGYEERVIIYNYVLN